MYILYIIYIIYYVYIIHYNICLLYYYYIYIINYVIIITVSFLLVGYIQTPSANFDGKKHCWLPLHGGSSQEKQLEKKYCVSMCFIYKHTKYIHIYIIYMYIYIWYICIYIWYIYIYDIYVIYIYDMYIYIYVCVWYIVDNFPFEDASINGSRWDGVITFSAHQRCKLRGRWAFGVSSASAVQSPTFFWYQHGILKWMWVKMKDPGDHRC